jgi:hypothetical protein
MWSTRSKEKARELFRDLSEGSRLKVTWADDTNKVHTGPDGVERPGVSYWRLKKSEFLIEAHAEIERAEKWSRAGGGNLTITRLAPDFAIVEHRNADGLDFSGLWHESEYGPIRELHRGDQTPKLVLKEAKIVGIHSHIRLKLA